jgi:hypothetical protein
MVTKKADKPTEEAPQPVDNREFRRVHQKLKAAGVLATNLGIPPNLKRLTDEEIEKLGVQRPGARPSEEWIKEDRGNY